MKEQFIPIQNWWLQIFGDDESDPDDVPLYWPVLGYWIELEGPRENRKTWWVAISPEDGHEAECFTSASDRLVFSMDNPNLLGPASNTAIAFHDPRYKHDLNPRETK